MKRTLILAALVLAAACSPKAPVLKDSFKGKFLIGSAVNEQQIREIDVKGDSVLFRHFNCIEPENCLKSAEIMPTFGNYQWELADKYVEFGEKHGLEVFGHCLLWHSQLTPDFCYDAEGKLIDQETLKARIKQHIYTVVGRYKGRIKGWDVVNEAILEDGSWRNSPFYQIMGWEFIPWAFQCANEADPNLELYYNDYSMHEPGKFETALQMVKDLQARGIRIDALGFQAHIGMDYPDLALYESFIRRVKDETGIDVCITELDMSILPTVSQSADVSGMSFYQAMRDPEMRERVMKELDPYREGIPEDVFAAWNKRFGDVLDMFLRNSDAVRRVNVWGICDAQSWKNGFPIPGRQDSPLWFDREYKIKPFLNNYGR